MKGLIKFIPVALGLLTLASCNSEDFFGGDNASKKATLELTIESMGDDATTRTAYTAKNGRTFLDGDRFTVYDDELHKYDYYEYNSANKFFELDGQRDLTEPKFVAYPSEAVATTAWEKETRSTSITMGIKSEWDFEEIDQDGTTYYVSQLPMWGTAEADGENIKAKVNFLTSYIKITLDNALNNAKAVRIRAYEDIAGTKPANIAGLSYAKLSENEVPLAETQLSPIIGAAAGYPAVNTITVNLEGHIESSKSCIFIPLIAGHYGKVIAEYLPSGAGNVWGNATVSPYVAGNEVTIKTWYDQNFERGGLPYGANYNSFKATAKSVKELNDVLATKTKETGNIAITINAGEKTQVSDDDATIGNTIQLPTMACEELTLNINQFEGAAVGQTLNITSAGFAKKVVLQLPKTTATAADRGLSKVTTINVNLPEAEITLAGQYDLNAEGADVTLNIQNAAAINFGDGNKDSKFKGQTLIAEIGDVAVKAKAVLDGDLVISANHRSKKITMNGTANSITVNPSVLASAKNTEISVGGTVKPASLAADAITIADASNDASLTVAAGGVVLGDIENAGTGAITVTGLAEDITTTTGKVTINGASNYKAAGDDSPIAYAKVNNVTTNGDVEIALNKEGAAVAGSLTMKKGQTLDLKQGYVKTIANATGGGSSKVTVNLNTTGNYIAINSVGADVQVSGTTKWNGEVIGGGITVGTGADVADAAAKNAVLTTVTVGWNNYADAATAVYTATGLVMNKGTFALKNNVDLNNKTWTPVAATAEIVGGGFTISNLKVAVPESGKLAAGPAAAAATAGLGLFTDLQYNVTNLTLDGVTIEALKFTDTKATPGSHVVDNIGALAGKVTTSAVALTAVTVKNVNLSSTGGAKAIGGIVGTNSSALTLTGVKLEGTNSIQGYYQMGGFVGYAAGDVTIATKAAAGTVPAIVCAATASFKANHNSATTTPALDKKYLSIGNFIGEADHTKKFDITCAAADIKAALTADLTIFPGYTKHNVGVNFYDYKFGQHLIGWSGDADFTTPVSINEKNYQRYDDKATWDNATEYLYYIDM